MQSAKDAPRYKVQKTSACISSEGSPLPTRMANIYPLSLFHNSGTQDSPFNPVISTKEVSRYSIPTLICSPKAIY